MLRLNVINNVNAPQKTGQAFGGLGFLYKHTHTHTHTQFSLKEWISVLWRFPFSARMSLVRASFVYPYFTLISYAYEKEKSV